MIRFFIYQGRDGENRACLLLSFVHGGAVASVGLVDASPMAARLMAVDAA